MKIRNIKKQNYKEEYEELKEYSKKEKTITVNVNKHKKINVELITKKPTFDTKKGFSENFENVYAKKELTEIALIAFKFCFKADDIIKVMKMIEEQNELAKMEMKYEKDDFYAYEEFLDRQEELNYEFSVKLSKFKLDFHFLDEEIKEGIEEKKDEIISLCTNCEIDYYKLKDNVIEELIEELQINDNVMILQAFKKYVYLEITEL